MHNDVIGSRITLLHLMITELIKHYRADDSKNIKHFILLLEDKYWGVFGGCQSYLCDCETSPKLMSPLRTDQNYISYIKYLGNPRALNTVALFLTQWVLLLIMVLYGPPLFFNGPILDLQRVCRRPYLLYFSKMYSLCNKILPNPFKFMLVRLYFIAKKEI